MSVLYSCHQDLVGFNLSSVLLATTNRIEILTGAAKRFQLN